MAQRSSTKSPEPTARGIAAYVLERVEKDRAFAKAVLEAEFRRHPQLEARERALCTELVYGCLRTRQALFDRLTALASPKFRKDAVLSSQLLVAAYQILFLDRVPAFAAVNAAVDAVRRSRGPRVAGFANAVLRRLAAEPPTLTRSEAIAQSAPAWLLERLEASVGEENAKALLGASLTPWVGVRVRSQGEVPEWLSQQPKGQLSPLARLVSLQGDLRRCEGYPEGRFVIQEEGSQLVALALGAKPGERVLDACAGRGQKASLLAEQVGHTGELWASDKYPKKLEELGREFQRLGLPPARTLAVDLTRGTADMPVDFDRVLVDAPCTGVGTLARRPEIALRLKPEDPRRMSELATTILRNASRCLRPGGRLVFAVCSVLEEECEAPLEKVCDVLRPVPFDSPVLQRLVGNAATLKTSPLEHGTEGYFLASLERH